MCIVQQRTKTSLTTSTASVQILLSPIILITKYFFIQHILSFHCQDSNLEHESYHIHLKYIYMANWLQLLLSPGTDSWLVHPVTQIGLLLSSFMPKPHSAYSERRQLLLQWGNNINWSRRKHSAMNKICARERGDWKMLQKRNFIIYTAYLVMFCDK